MKTKKTFHLRDKERKTIASLAKECKTSESEVVGHLTRMMPYSTQLNAIKIAEENRNYE